MKKHADPWLRSRDRLYLCILLCVLFAACTGRDAATATPTLQIPTPRPSPTATDTPPTPMPQHLVVCSTEPQAVSPFVPSQAGMDLLALFYEEPVERVGYRWEARLLERLPSLDSGDVVTRPAPVIAGSRYADAIGLIQQYTGEEVMSLPQLVVTFTLKSDLLWSDGTPITAKDAVFGYHLAQAPETQGRWRELAERTARFIAVDDYTLRWEGIPGFLDTDYPGFLFPLQPTHRWQGQRLDTILQDRTPPATGPFRIVAWESGREVRLEPNPYYSGSQPRLESVVVRFPQQVPESWATLLMEDRCDVALPDPVILTDWEPWAQLGTAGEALVWADVAPVLFRLDFNLNPADTEMISPVKDVEVREAIALCVNGTGLTQALPAEMLVPAGGFVPPNHPSYSPAGHPTHDPARAKGMLARAGWRDEDRNGIREAHDVPGFSEAEPLSITLHLPPQYMRIATHVAADLQACGIHVDLAPTELATLYTPSADSPLFGRTYEMALVGWQTQVPDICGVWLSERTPAPETAWQGENFSGFASQAYDVACKQALTAMDPEAQAAALTEAQKLLNADRPSAFIAWRPFWFVSRPEVQGLKPDASTYGTLWNIEDVFIGTPEAEE